MLIIPAIDLQDGCVVRYVQGRRDKKIYSRDPVKTARYWVKQGAGRLHLVDLDGAFSGQMKNFSHIRDIVKAVRIPVQCGGGIRSGEAVRKLLKAGVNTVILGTKAVGDRKFLQKTAADFASKVMVSVDTEAGRVMTRGWQHPSEEIDAIDFINEIKELGIEEIVFTDTAKDGTLKGPNIKEATRILRQTGIRMIVSGGISCLADIGKVAGLQKKGVIGVIIGTALYEGRFTLKQALQVQ